MGERIPDPKTVDDYNARAMANAKVEGYGIFGVKQTLPCPGCAAPGWKSFKIIEVEQVMPEPATCWNCGRTFKVLVSHEGGGTSMEFVQTGGDDVPDYLPPIRRVQE